LLKGADSGFLAVEITADGTRRFVNNNSFQEMIVVPKTFAPIGIRRISLATTTY